MSYEELDVWKESHKLALEIYKLTKNFPKDERFRIVDQICRAAISVPTNIAEGTGRHSKKEFSQFLYIARGSVEETKYLLLLAKDLNYLKHEICINLQERYNKVGKMLNGLISSIRK
ncbi:four helix bundle protein [Candidatus Aerophobetes bacterium]|nr:four helix bundle protein [Candidatus Aerophobetes bacterium]